jgi:predicted Zn-dependent protease
MDVQLPGCMPATVLRGRKHLALKEFPAARDWLSRAIAQHPHEIWPRILYSHVLLQDGSERAAVIQALRNVLALDPNHAEPRRSLETLLKDEGGPKNGV